MIIENIWYLKNRQDNTQWCGYLRYLKSDNYTHIIWFLFYGKGEVRKLIISLFLSLLLKIHSWKNQSNRFLFFLIQDWAVLIWRLLIFWLTVSQEMRFKIWHHRFIRHKPQTLFTLDAASSNWRCIVHTWCQHQKNILEV